MKEYEFLWLNIILFHWLIGVFIYRDREYQKKKRVWEWAAEEIRTLVFREIQFVYTWDIQTCKAGNWICGPGTQSRGRHGRVIYLSVAIEPEWMSPPGETTQWAGEQSLRLSFRCPTVSGCEEEDGLGVEVWPERKEGIPVGLESLEPKAGGISRMRECPVVLTATEKPGKKVWKMPAGCRNKEVSGGWLLYFEVFGKVHW